MGRNTLAYVARKMGQSIRRWLQSAKLDDRIANDSEFGRVGQRVIRLADERPGSIELHPLRQYFDAGIPVSLNTDDPMFFGNSLAMELESAQRAHRFTRVEIRRLMLSS